MRHHQIEARPPLAPAPQPPQRRQAHAPQGAARQVQTRQPATDPLRHRGIGPAAQEHQFALEWRLIQRLPVQVEQINQVTRVRAQMQHARRCGRCHQLPLRP
jgi:hypothetical protein